MEATDRDLLITRSPGRVYARDADESRGEIRVGEKAARVYVLFGDWQRIPNVYRVEFDQDAACGDATIYARFTINGSPMPDPDDETSPASVRFRAYARLERVESAGQGAFGSVEVNEKSSSTIL